MMAHTIMAIAASLVVLPCTGWAQEFVISLAGAFIPSDSRVVSIDLTVVPGYLTGISGIPAGWKLTIDNDAEEKLHITGGGAVGAALLFRTDLGAIKFRFHEDKMLGIAFSCTGEIDATRDFRTVSTYNFSSQNCRKVSGR
jgi:hypothetical protein